MSKPLVQDGVDNFGRPYRNVVHNPPPHLSDGPKPLNLVQARRKARSLWGAKGMAWRPFGSKCAVGFLDGDGTPYESYLVTCGAGDTWEAAFIDASKVHNETKLVQPG